MSNESTFTLQAVQPIKVKLKVTVVVAAEHDLW